MYERELEIQALMAEGMPKDLICQEIGRKYKISQRTVETQYYQVVDSMKNLVDEGRAELRANLMARNDLLFKRSLAEGKYKTALDVNVAQAKIGGLFNDIKDEQKPPEVIEIGEQDFSGKPQLVPDIAENE